VNLPCDALLSIGDWLDSTRCLKDDSADQIQSLY